ncbi:MAG: hypothetical protein ACI8RD_014078, partial [Bacillariaceae sp.]
DHNIIQAETSSLHFFVFDNYYIGYILKGN